MNEKLCANAEIVNQDAILNGFSCAAPKYCIKKYLAITEELMFAPYQEGFSNYSYISESTAAYVNLRLAAHQSSNVGILAQDVRVRMNMPVDWMKSKEYSRNVQYKVMSWLVLDAPFLADSEKVTDYYQPGLDYIVSWVDTFIATGNKHDFAWYDMAVGQRSTKLAYILCRAIAKGESKEVVEKLIVCAEIHIRELSNIDTIAVHSNHGLFQMLGLLALGSQLPFLKSSEAAVKLARKLISQMLESHFCADGMHSEHSPMYHFYMTNYLSILSYSGYMQSKKFELLAAKAISASSYLVKPDGRILGFGDSHSSRVERRALFDLHGDGANKYSPEGLKYFESYGMVVHSHYINNKIRDYFAFSSAFHSRQHKHADDFNFEFHYKGKPIFVDTGTYTYQYDLPERIYAESTRAHNCLEIDNCNYSRFNKDAFGSGVSFAKELGGCLIIESLVNRKRLMPSSFANTNLKFADAIEVSIKHKRIMVYHPEKYLLVIDVMASHKEHDYTQWFNLDDQLSVKSGEVVNVFDENNVNILSLTPLGGNKSIQHIKGGVEPRLHGWISKDGYTLTERSAIGMTCKGANQTLATLIDLNPLVSKKIFFNSGTNGKYIRFKVGDGNDTMELIYRLRNKCNELSYKENEIVNTLTLDC